MKLTAEELSDEAVKVLFDEIFYLARKHVTDSSDEFNGVIHVPEWWYDVLERGFDVILGREETLKELHVCGMPVEVADVDAPTIHIAD